MGRLLPLVTIISTGVNHGKILGSHPRRRPNRGFAPIKTRTERGRSAGQSAITPSEVKFAPNFERELEILACSSNAGQRIRKKIEKNLLTMRKTGSKYVLKIE